MPDISSFNRTPFYVQRNGSGHYMVSRKDGSHTVYFIGDVFREQRGWRARLRDREVAGLWFMSRAEAIRWLDINAPSLEALIAKGEDHRLGAPRGFERFAVPVEDRGPGGRP
jgi:hypothetical protein